MSKADEPTPDAEAFPPIRGTHPEIRIEPPIGSVEVSSIEERLAELVKYNRAVITLILSKGIISGHELDHFAQIRERIDQQITGLQTGQEVAADTEISNHDDPSKWQA